MSDGIQDPELLAEFASESSELLHDVAQQLIACESALDAPARKAILDAIFRNVHSVKGNSSFFGLEFIQRLAHGSENLLDDLRQGRINLRPDIISTLLSNVDLLLELIAAVDRPHAVCSAEHINERLAHIESLRLEEDDHATTLRGAIAGVQAMLSDLTADQRGPIEHLLNCIDPSQTQAADSEAAPAETSPKATTQPAQAADTAPSEGGDTTPKGAERRVMRIDEERIDAFLGYVGELVVIGDMFNHILKRFQSLDVDRSLTTGLGQVTGTFQSLSAKLQAAIMSVRTVPARQLLRKAPKLVRDIAHSQGKNIRVQVSGEDIEIDKGYVDLLDAPLVHMVRNAADHGIEMPDLRRKAGKEAEGLISIAIEQDNESIIFRLTDDGGGINRDRIAAKARDIGVISADQDLDEDALIECMFTAGVSTAEAVSDISGRGVGMDVVKRAIEQAGGRIAVDSVIGTGTTFTISLPRSVTTQIGMGYFVRCGSELFILDLDSVLETFHHTTTAHTTPDRITVIQRRGVSMPLVDVGKLLGIRSPEPPQVAITAEIQRRPYAILVDEVVGIKQMVKLPLELPGRQNLPFQGVAMQGDGSLAIILDLGRLIQADELTAS